MNLIPQQARDGVGTLLDPLALLLIRWRVRPNLITTVGTLVVVGSAAAFALGEVRWGGWLLLVAGLFDMVDGRVARQGGTTTTFGAFYDSTLDRVGEALLFGGIARHFLQGGGPAARLTPAAAAPLVAVAASPLVASTPAPPEGLGEAVGGGGGVCVCLIAGGGNVRRGSGLPMGALSQMGTIRLGRRTERRAPKIKDFVPIADLKDLVFAAWDPFPDDAYRAARKAGVLEPPHLEPIADFLKGIQPLPSAFDQSYVKRLNGPNAKSGKAQPELAEQLLPHIPDFQPPP